MFADKVLKLLLVAIGHRDVVLLEDNAATVYHLYLALLDDERAVHTDKALGLHQPFFRMSPAEAHTDGRTQTCHEGKHHQMSAPSEPFTGRWRTGKTLGHEIGTGWLKGSTMTELEYPSQSNHEHHIEQQEPSYLVAEQVTGNQIQIVGIEHEEAAQGYDAVTQVLCPIHPASPLHQENGKQEYQQPTDGVYRDFQAFLFQWQNLHKVQR